MTAVRLLRVPLSSGSSPTAALRALASDPWPFALTGRWAGGSAIVGSSPLRLATPDEDPFALLDAQPQVDLDGDTDVPADAVGGGWFGWLGYGLGARVERLPSPPPRPAPLPPFQLAYYDHVLRRDANGRWWFEALASPEREAALADRLDDLRARLGQGERMEQSERLAQGEPLAQGERMTRSPDARLHFHIAGDGAAAHVAAVADCRERIGAGEIFQANICLRFEAAWHDGDVAELYANAAERLRPAYGAAFPAPWGGIASLSPELFLRRRGRLAETAPIKGTIARDEGEPAEQPARSQLLASAKDHAEHVMIVDLMRNDLGRVSEYGSVVAARTPEAQAHPGLWHLVSRVQGTLRPGVGDGELLRATFPPGSVTGAPKVQAMHVISALESTGREVYTGAIGYASPLAGLELNVAIRTFEARDGRLWLGAGGGIVADSDPRAELEECFVKVRPLIAAIGGTVEPAPSLTQPEPAPAQTEHASAQTAPPSAQTEPASGQTDPPSAQPEPAPAQTDPTSAQTAPSPPQPAPPALPRPRRRPDPARGVFETLLVLDGAPQQAEAHLARLAASVARLYDLALPPDLLDRIVAVAAPAVHPASPTSPATPAPPATDAPPDLSRARLRIVVTPSGAIDVQLVPDRARELPIPLVPFTLPGGLGPHKWLDRDLLDALTAEARARAGNPQATPLLLDGGGAVLEAAWGNVFAVEGETLVTPPADGRILPGVTRRLLIERSMREGVPVAEQRIGIERLARADSILLTSAAAGAVAAVLASGSSGAARTPREEGARAERQTAAY
jgi:para-aminobenzoate synthetase/4-amino-4-deoxychorismate lyase